MSEPTLVDATLPEAPAVETPPPAEVPVQETRAGLFTAEDIAKAREQEKQKLYPQLQKMKEEVESLKAARDEQVRLEEERRLAAEAEARRKAESEMDVRDLLKQKEMEWTQQLEAERLERERAFALLQQEQQYNDLREYRTAVVEANRDTIVPELIDLIDGNSREEIDAKVADLTARSVRIIESTQQATQQQRRDMAGARVTAPAAGPLENEPGQKTFSAEDISKMSMQEYAKYRTQFVNDGRGRGLFG